MDAYERAGPRARVWLSLSLSCLLAGAALLTAAQAHALGVERMTVVQQEHLDELTQWAYRNGATVTAPSCGTVCTKLWLSEHRPMPNQATSAQLWAELNTLQQSEPAKKGVKLLPSLGRFVRTISPYSMSILLGVESFRLGWKIGGRINKWLGITVPEDPAEVNAYRLQWYEEGSTEPFRTYHETMAMPYDGFTVINNNNTGIVGQIVAGPRACNQPGPSSLPGGFVPLTWWWNDCRPGYGYPLYPVTAIGLVAKPSTLVPDPVQDYAGQPYDAATEGVADPGTSVVQERLVEGLDSGRYPVLNQWLDHMLGGESDNPLCEPVEGARTIAIPAIMPGQTVVDYEDCLDTLGLTEHVRVTVPVEEAVLAQPARGVVRVAPAEGALVDLDEEPQVRISMNPDPLPEPEALDGSEDCELSEPTYPVPPPSNDPTPEPFDAITDPALVASPTFVSTHANTTLRWGVVDLIAEPTFNYGGWGYQHIAAKHGWLRADDAATRAALNGTPFPNENPNAIEGYVYFGPEYVRDGMICTRVVVVEYGTAQEEPAPKGIITSFGARVAKLPMVFIP